MSKEKILFFTSINIFIIFFYIYLNKYLINNLYLYRYFSRGGFELSILMHIILFLLILFCRYICAKCVFRIWKTTIASTCIKGMRL